MTLLTFQSLDISQESWQVVFYLPTVIRDRKILPLNEKLPRLEFIVESSSDYCLHIITFTQIGFVGVDVTQVPFEQQYFAIVWITISYLIGSSTCSMGSPTTETSTGSSLITTSAGVTTTVNCFFAARLAFLNGVALAFSAALFFSSERLARCLAALASRSCFFFSSGLFSRHFFCLAASAFLKANFHHCLRLTVWVSQASLLLFNLVSYLFCASFSESIFSFPELNIISSKFL